SAHIILNESGDVIEENLFSPFAEPLQGVIENKFSYEAKEYDSLVKDYDFHFRKYDPKLRIFTQPDTLIQNVYDPQSLNRYAFERNNPLKNTDPTGHQLNIANSPQLAIFFLALGGLLFLGKVLFSSQEADESQETQPQPDTQPAEISIDPEYKQRQEELEHLQEPFSKLLISDNVELRFKAFSNVAVVITKDEERTKEEVVECLKCVFRPQVDNQGNLILVLFNQAGQEVERFSTNYIGGVIKSNVVQRDDGTWVIEGGPDDDGTRVDDSDDEDEGN
ncbi:hypothetical protein HY637_00840, partial [Candidatus Woesearchaeota archaeon]|nr:hypothetical protein [Candidatus Woesearchaeota archaeon]